MHFSKNLAFDLNSSFSMHFSCLIWFFSSLCDILQTVQHLCEIPVWPFQQHLEVISPVSVICLMHHWVKNGKAGLLSFSEWLLLMLSFFFFIPNYTKVHILICLVRIPQSISSQPTLWSQKVYNNMMFNLCLAFLFFLPRRWLWLTNFDLLNLLQDLGEFGFDCSFTYRANL